MHDVLPAIKTGFSNVFRFSGRMNRTHFWLWIGTLYIVTALIRRGEFLFFFRKESIWSNLESVIEQQEILKLGFRFVGESWPPGLTLAPLPFYYFASGGIAIPAAMPLFLLLHFLIIGPIVQRARDAGYSIFWTVILLYWSVIGTIALFAIVAASVATLGFGAIMPFYLALGYLEFVAPTVSYLTALVAIFILTSPSKIEPGPPPSEVTP